jgi:hypothetical protein
MSETPGHDPRNGRFTSGNKYKFRPTDAPPGSDPSRDKLRIAQTRRLEEQTRLDGLEAAQDRVAGEIRTANQTLRRIEDQLQELRDGDRIAAAYAFANDEELADDAATLAAKNAELDRAQSEIARLSAIDLTLGEEVHQARMRLGLKQMTWRDELGSVICTSREFQGLLDDLTAAWGRLRGIRKALQTISSNIGGFPYSIHTTVYRSVALDPDVLGEPTEESWAEAWAQTMREITENPDFPLPSPPSGGGGFA